MQIDPQNPLPFSAIQHYFPELDEFRLKQLERLVPLYQEWNAQINVISRKDMDHFVERHVLHSLSIARFTKFSPGSRIMDLGTGGGFPAVPLAIYFPEVQFVAVDSIGKKIKVVQEVVNALGITNVEAIHSRAETVKGPFDFVVSRAVADLSELVKWTSHLISRKDNNALPNGLICLKGGDLTEEIKPFRKAAQVYDLSSWYSESFFETKKLVYLPL
ncbi:MAG: Ribosomal small subunit methyltransferase [Bacteroidota bacterium]